MDIQSKKNESAIVFLLTEELIGASAKDVFDVVSPLVSSNYSSIILDIHNVPYIDSLGLGTLIDLHQMLRDSGKKLQLCGPGEMIRQLFWDSSLDEIFEIITRDQLAEELKF